MQTGFHSRKPGHRWARGEGWVGVGAGPGQARVGLGARTVVGLGSDHQTFKGTAEVWPAQDLPTPHILGDQTVQQGLEVGHEGLCRQLGLPGYLLQDLWPGLA